MVKKIFNTNKLKTEQTNNFSTFFDEILSDLKTLLKLDSLEKIIISTDFSEDIIKIQNEYELDEISYTNRKDGSAVAKVITNNASEENLKQSIIIKDFIILGLFIPEQAKSSFHILHHELCHVHDYYNQYEISKISGGKEKKLNKLQNVLITHANTIWSEYIAVRLSALSTPKDQLDDFDIPYLLQLIVSTKKNMEKKILNYRYNGDTLKLFLYLQKETGILLKIAATTQGYIDGLKIHEHESYIETKNKIEKLNFDDIWMKQWDQLRLLFDIYPNWKDINQLNKLGQVVQKCWEHFGIYPKYLKESKEIHIDVPS
jgi:hypothetical protein